LAPLKYAKNQRFTINKVVGYFFDVAIMLQLISACEYKPPFSPLQHFCNIFSRAKRKGLAITTNTSPNVDL
jgi:hypothetical protein